MQNCFFFSNIQEPLHFHVPFAVAVVVALTAYFLFTAVVPPIWLNSSLLLRRFVFLIVEASAKRE